MFCNSENPFDVEDHYGVYLKKETLRALVHPFVLTNKPVDISRKKKTAAIKKVERNRIKYNDFLEINRMFVDYLTRIRGIMNVSQFVNKMSVAELTGAKVRIVGGRCGIIVEERVNSIVVVFEDDSVKTYLKKINDFVVEHDSIEYIFIGSKMKFNRFTKK